METTEATTCAVCEALRPYLIGLAVIAVGYVVGVVAARKLRGAA